jgi:arginine utilization regulatory protein
LLAEFFLDKFNSRERNKNLRLSKKAVEVLEYYNFPGNVRELRNIIEDAFVFCDGSVIYPQNLSFRKPFLREQNNQSETISFFSSITHLSYHDAMEVFDKEYFLRLLQENFWNINEAAKKARLSREWLSKKVNRLDLKRSVNNT